MCSPPTETKPTRPTARAADRALVSAPILHLKRRSRALAEILEWREEDENWSEEVLNHCAETAEDLRDIVAGWPDDEPMADRLRDAIDQACDTRRAVAGGGRAGPGRGCRARPLSTQNRFRAGNGCMNENSRIEDPSMKQDRIIAPTHEPRRRIA
jgi:hypothetical protein